MKIIETQSYLKIKEAIGTDFGRDRGDDFHPGSNSYGDYYPLIEQHTRRLMNLSDEVLQERIDNLINFIRQIDNDFRTKKLNPEESVVLDEKQKEELHHLISEKNRRKRKNNI